MKIKTLNIVAIMLIMLVVVIAGCTSKSPSSGNSTPASGSSATSSSSQQVGSTINSSSVFGTNYNWIQYQVTGNFRGNETQTNTKIERSMGDYKGTQAVHLKITSTSSKGRDMVSDIYYDKDKNSILGGTTTMTFNGQTMTREIPAIQLSGQGFNNFNEEASLTFEGTESVTVPAGTYPSASKYTKSVNETTVTYWAASGVPVPVKEMTSSPRGSSNMELVGWG